jgi:ABC-2 type transport system permease protein
MSGATLAGLGLLVRKELREQVRTLRLPVVVILFAILGLLSPVFARYIREIISSLGSDDLVGILTEPTVGDAVVQFTKNLGQFGVLAAILVTMGSVAAEKERGTAAFVLTKPVSRGAFLGAKVVALGALLALATVIAGVLCWIYAAILFEPLPIAGFAAAVILVWLSLGVFAAITFLASVVAPSALVAGGIGIAALLVAGILSALPVVGPYLPTGLWGLADRLALGEMPDPLAGPVLVNVGVIVVAVALSWWAFRRQEL